MVLLWLFIIFGLAVSTDAWAVCNKPHPCLTLVVDPSSPVISDVTAPGTVIATVSVSVEPRGAFSGKVTFAPPYGNDAGLFALSGSDLVLVNSPPTGNSVQYVTMVATE